MELELFRAITQSQESMALATIIDVKGSSPRHTGSKMLLGARTGRLGTVGGGRGEASALQACRKSLDDHRPALNQVEMTGTAILGPEMVCGGTNTMLIEPLDDLEPYRIALDLLTRGQRVLFLKRILAGEHGITVQVALLDQDGTPVYGNADGAVSAARALNAGRPHFEEESRIFYDPLFPEEDLLILGAGHVGQALAAAAPALGFRVTVVDDRPEFLAPERFPSGTRTLLSGFEQAIAAFPFNSATYAVVLTRGHLLDLECVRGLLKRECRYAGFMGSARKTRFIIEQVLQDGCDPAKVDTLWGPVGLDIGAETPEELAIAILGEMIAVRRNSRMVPELRRAHAARRAK